MGRYLEGILLVAALIGLYFTSYYSYLLFHALTELFAIIITVSIFMIAWNARHYIDSSYLVFIGVAFLFTGVLESAHTLAYKGMGVFQWSEPTNLPTQLWIANRYLTSLSFLLASFFVRRKPRVNIVFFGYFLVTALLLVSIFYWRNFPVSYVEGMGLTSFKIYSEYVISLLFLGAIALLYLNRQEYDSRVYKILIAALVFNIGTEIVFTQYINVYGIANMIGHFLMVISFYLIYKGIIETGLAQPYSLLFRNLKKSEESLEHRAAELSRVNARLKGEMTEREKAQQELGKYRKHLEELVAERTAQLMQSHQNLEAEIAERKRAEAQLRVLSNRTIQLQEEERQAIARELHDQTGQSLTVMNLLLAKIKRSINQPGEKTLADIEESQEVLKELSQQVRTLSTNLHPSMLDNIGLIPTLEWYTGEFTKRTGIAIDFRYSGLENNLPLKARITVYRIIQESLTNIARYAGVKEASVQLHLVDKNMIVFIADHGVGFDPAAVPVTSSGIRGMHERALSLGGALEVISSPGNGTRIEVNLPLDADLRK